MIERPMRRKDRAMEQERMEALMQRSTCAILATVCEDGTPYAVPVSCVYYNKALYFHTAVKGHKVENMEARPDVSLCMTGDLKVFVDAGKYSHFSSVVVFGKARLVTDAEEKENALVELMAKYMPAQLPVARDDARRLDKAVKVFRIDIERMTGKEKLPYTEEVDR